MEHKVSWENRKNRSFQLALGLSLAVERADESHSASWMLLFLYFLKTLIPWQSAEMSQAGVAPFYPYLVLLPQEPIS